MTTKTLEAISKKRYSILRCVRFAHLLRMNAVTVHPEQSRRSRERRRANGKAFLRWLPVTVVFTAALIALFNPASVFACGSCYGAADAPATNGMNFAILSMLGITGSVLAALTSFFLYLRRRARVYLATIDDHGMKKEKGGI